MCAVQASVNLTTEVALAEVKLSQTRQASEDAGLDKLQTIAKELAQVS